MEEGKYPGIYGTRPGCYATKPRSSIRIDNHLLELPNKMPAPQEEVPLHIGITIVYNSAVKYIVSAVKHVSGAVKSLSKTLSRKIRGLDSLI